MIYKRHEMRLTVSFVCHVGWGRGGATGGMCGVGGGFGLGGR